MKTLLGLKFIIGMTVAFMFWFFTILVFMVYSFMPASKYLNQLIFTVAFPTLYLILMNLLYRRIFKEKGWKNIGINTLIIIASAAVSLFILDKGNDFANIMGS